MKRSWTGLIVLAAMAGSMVVEAQTIRTNPGFYTRFVPRNDDESSDLEPLGFTINFFGKIRTAAYVNNNGNLTFDSALATYTPFGLLSTQREIIAPFFADVDTRPDGSMVVTYGPDTVNGHPAFAANYVNVGYYANHVDKLNSFQVVLISRDDIGPGDFDIEFNYEKIQWETGDASNGVNGFGGTPASVGWSNGTDTAFEYPGSLVPGSFLDGGPYALVNQTSTGRVVNIPGAPPGTKGRLIYRARDGVISPGIVISGGQLTDATVGVPYSAQFTVAGADPPYTWALQPDLVAPPGLTLSNDGVLAGTPTTVGTYSFTVSVTATTEDGEVTVYERGSLTVRPPVLRITTYCPVDDGYAGTPYSLHLAASGSTTGYVWSVDDPYSIPPGMALSASGLLAGTPLVPGTYQMSLRVAADGASDAAPATKLCRLNVNPSSVRLSSGCSMPHGTVGVPYAQYLDPTGGVAPYQFQLIGQLPKGLALTPGGEVAGTPGFWGVWPFKIATTDAQGSRTEQDCSLIVDPAQFSVANSCPLPAGTTGVPYDARLAGGYTWSLVGSLPAGLTLSPDGNVSGTPMVAGPSQFRLIASNGDGQQAGEACSLLVERGPLAVTGCPLPAARRGDSYSGSLQGVGGTGPYTFSAMGTLPPGISLGTGGQVSGTPAQAGVFPFTVLMRDRALASTVQACSLTVAPSALRLTTACPLADAQVGQAYNVHLMASGGVPPYSFFIDGYLPDGLVADTAGSITGTPARVGGRAFSIYTFDSLGNTAPETCSIAVTSPQVPEITLADPPATVAPATANLKLQVKLAAASNVAVEGKVVMSVTSDARSSNAVANTPDPHLAFSNGQRTIAFTIPAGATSAEITIPSTGTVASTVVLSLTDLRASGAPIVQNPVSKTFLIPAAAPTVTSACYSRTDTGLDFKITGITTTRELTRAVLNIPGLPNPTAGADLPPIPPEFIIGARQGELTVDLSAISTEYFGSAYFVNSGGAFTLTVPVTVDLAPDAPMGDVMANIYNTIGGAGQQTVSRCQ